MPAATAVPPSPPLPTTEELLHGVFVSASVGIKLVDLADGHVVRANPALERMLGYSHAELAQRAFADFTHPDDRAAEARLHAEMRAGARESFSIVERLVRRDGSALWTRVTSSLARDADGVPRFAVGMVEDLTREREADARWRDAEQRYRLIVETASEGIWLLDAEDRTTFANPALERMLGYAPGELVGARLSDVLLGTPVIAPALRRRGPGGTEHRNVRYRRKDGAAIEVRVGANGIFAEDGTYLGMLAMVTDISELQRSRGAVAARLRQLEALSALGREILADVPLPELLERAAAHVAVGLAVDVATVLERLPDGSLRVAAAHGWDAAAGGRALVLPPGSSHAGYQLAVGDERVLVEDVAYDPRFTPSPVLVELGVRSGLSCVIDGADGPFGVLGAHSRERRAFTEDDANFVDAVASLLGGTIRRDHARVLRAAAEGELRRTGERFRMLAENAQDIVFRLRLGDDPGYEYVGPAVERITGLPPEAFYRDPELALRYAHPDDRPLVLGLRQEERVAPVQLRWLHPDGRTVWLERRTTLVRDAEGRPVALEGIVRDVSERVLAEERRRLLEEQLHHAHTLEAVGRLAGGVAHDFNNILLAIRGFGELALSELARGDADVSDDVREMLDAAGRASDLTRQLLALGRRQVLHVEVLDLRSVVEEIAKLLRRLLGDHVELATTTADEPVPVLADRGQLEQVLVNLAVNARDAMPDGGRVSIEVAREGETALLRVADTGAGMDAETLERAFEPFFTTKGEDGTGLGLATVHGIVTQSNGCIDVTSARGRGTTVSVALPLAAAAAVPDETAPAPSPRGDAAILLVEDDDAVRAAVARMLADHGYRVVEAADCEAAAAAAAGEPVDLLLTDVALRGANGWETAERVRALAPGVPVVFMSGYAQEPQAREAELDERSAFLHKPFTGDELALRVAALLARATT